MEVGGGGGGDTGLLGCDFCGVYSMFIIITFCDRISKTDWLMNSILFAKPIKPAAFIPISLLTTEHSWYLGTAIIRENPFSLATGIKRVEWMIPIILELYLQNVGYLLQRWCTKMKFQVQYMAFVLFSSKKIKFIIA